tara:strand:- start:1032 stop:2858 length:1827 start_codon:yes stop_codon:yes gene_type:complete
MVSLFNLAARKALQQGISKRVSKSGLQSVEDISVFPKPQRMFPENVRPAGGEYLNPATKDILTGKNVSRGNISITPEGKPSFRVSPVEKEIVGSPDIKGATQIKTNLFKKKAGWKWKEAPKGYEDVPTLVSVENKGKHYYTLDAQFPQGVNLTRYAKSKTEPRLRPTMKGFVEVGTPVGKINVRGREHIVYDKVINREAGGKVMAGGLSNLKKSININGQPHSLAWINPGEASALKAMGGSGKPGPMGIPSYQYDPSMGDFGEFGGVGFDYDPESSQREDDSNDTWQEERAEIIKSSGIGGGRSEIDPTGTDPETGFAFYADPETGEFGGDPRTTTRDQNYMERVLGYLTGGSSDKQVTEKQSDLLNRAKIGAYGTWRATTAGRDSLDPEKDFNEWFAQQDPNTLLAGSKIGDPFGHVTKVSMGIVNQQLINRAKENLQNMAESSRGVTEEEREKHGRQSMIDAAKSGKIEHLKDFTEKKELPTAMKFSLIGQLMNLASRTVIGTGTVGGIPVHVHENGDVTAISPEDSPGFDHEAMRGENVVPIKRKRLPPVAQPATLEPEKELTGMAKYYADLDPAATRAQGLASIKEDILPQVYSEEQIKNFNLA